MFLITFLEKKKSVDVGVGTRWQKMSYLVNATMCWRLQIKNISMICYLTLKVSMFRWLWMIYQAKEF